MKKFFKICSLMLVFVLALVCSSCDDNPETANPDNPGTVTPDNPGTTNPDNPGTVTPQKTLESISLSGGKKEFKVGDTFDKGDLKVTAKYSDNTEEDVTTKATVSAPDMTQEGNKRVDVTYEGKTTNYTITVTKDNDEEEDPNKISYEVNVKAINGKPLALVIVSICLDGKEISYKMTASDGKASFNLSPAEYDVYIEPGQDGYTPKEEVYKISQENNSLEVICDMAVADGVAPSGHRYTSGDVMYDFTVTNTGGKTINLKTLLETKKLVVLNFWYTTCSWCVREFPLLEDAYERYKDDVAVIALDYQDGLQDIISFQDSYGLTFDVAKDEIGLTMMFPVSGFPTTVFIDRNGGISIIESGAITSQEKWDGIFDEFIGDTYVPVYTPLITGDDDTPVERPKPTISMPESSVLEAVANGDNFDGVYSAETNKDKDYSWPWIVSEDGDSIIPSNAGVNNSFATVHIKVNFENEQVFCFDYFSSTEVSDILYVLVNGNLVVTIAGRSTEWEVCTPYVSLESGEYEIVFLYMKDGSAAGGDDVVYIKNIRFITTEEITSPLYMERECSSGAIVGTEEDRKYTNYITPVFNSEDGFYHVGTVNGPLVLADLLSATHWSGKKLYEYAQNKELIINEKDYNDLITLYSSLATNSTVGYVPVTKELYDLLNLIADTFGEKQYSEQWLEMCVYFSAYGTNGEELPDPIRGLAPFDSYTAVESDQNFVEVDRTVMPKGLYFKFVPTQSGVYKINSIGTEVTEGWLYDENSQLICANDEGLRYYIIEAYNDPDNLGDPNFQLYYYFEQGKTYYIAVSFADPDHINDTLQFNVEYVGTEASIFTVCSPGWFTTENDDFTGAIISPGIKVELQSDGYYHHIDADGNVGSIIYADFMYFTNIFDLSLRDLIDKGAFNFTVDEEGKPADGADYTEEIRSYLIKMEYTGETFGCVKVDEDLAEILQMLMDKYTFKGIKDSWLKLCYYFNTLEEPAESSN